jgi:hypothetical protein
MELREALLQLDVIHRQMARTEKFRGYRALPTVCGSLLALIAAALQAWLVPQPADDLSRYLTIWIGTAIVAGLISGGDAWRRHLRDANESGMLIRLACEQFLPCVVAGAALTAVVARFTPDAAWMLPGLWSILFSLGLFASFLLAGCLLIALGPDRGGLAPWTMLTTFGVGQLGLAAVLATQPSGDDAAEEANDAA